MKKRIFKLSTISLLLIVFGLLATGDHVSGMPVIDQQQPVINTEAGVVIAIGGQGNQNLSQVVTAGVTGTLTEVRLATSCASGINLTLEIQGVSDDKPDGTVLASHTFTDIGSYATPPVFKSLPLPAPVPFSSGDRFAIVLKATPDPILICSTYPGPVGDPYPGGDAFFSSPEGWLKIFYNQEIKAGVDLPFQTVVEATLLQVSIDIKPGSFPNSINPNSRGRIPVAVLTTDTFDATTVDLTTVRFGVTGNEAIPVHAALEDVDLDGNTDLILHFNTQATGIQCGDASASLTGQTFSGQAFNGFDSINTVGCK